jgi:phosphate transport system substrate-binding protein
MKWRGRILALTIIGLVACGVPPRKQIWVVGSSTLYPFIAAAAEQYGRAGGEFTPIVEANGTGGGIKLFCGGVGLEYPDIANASRQIKDKEKELCAQHGVMKVTEFAVGFDGIVLANLKSSTRYHLTLNQLFLALAKVLPNEKGELVANHYQKWNEIDSALPATKIEVYGPPPTSGTRDAFVELVMEHECKALPAFVAAYPDEDKRKEQCRLLREDGAFIDAGENDNIIVQKLQSNKLALGLFGYSFLEQNMDSLQGSVIDSAEPSFEKIADGSYPISRSLYIYIKQQHVSLIAGLLPFAKEILSEKAIGAEGYLAYKGLIPLPRLSRNLNRERLMAIGMMKNNSIQ